MGLTNDATLESRVRLLAYSKLKQMGNANRMKELLGVIVEVRLDDGLDTLAAYKDGTARYLNQYEKMVVWDAPSPESGTIINGLFSAAENVVRKIGPWDGERRSAPEPGMCRLTFLVSGDLYFGEGPFSLFKNDPMAGPVIAEATKLLVFLTEKAG